MRCFHGTTGLGIKSILNGIDTKGENVTAWPCSDDDGAFYLYPMNKIDGDDLDERRLRGIDNALESARIQAAINGSTELYCIEFNAKGALLEDDWSCQNMADIASFISIDNLDKIEILAVYKANYNQYRAPFDVAALLDNREFNRYGLNSELLDIAEKIAENGCFLECYDIDYEEIEISELI